MAIVLTTIDLAKNVFQIHCADERGTPVMRKQVKRGKLVETIQNLPKCRIVMEACGGASHWARLFQAMGHEVQLIAPQFVKPFRKSNKNDRNDAEAICEAASRPTMRYVPVNTIEQQDIQMVHRVRSQLIKERTALCNQIRGLLTAYGIVIPQSLANLRKQLPLVLEDFTTRFQPRLREVIIPDAGRFITMDADGDLFGWAEMPRISYVVPRWLPDTIDRLHAYFGNIEAAGRNWQSCCFPIPLDWKTGALRALIMRMGRDLPDAWI